MDRHHALAQSCMLHTNWTQHHTTCTQHRELFRDTCCVQCPVHALAWGWSGLGHAGASTQDWSSRHGIQHVPHAPVLHAACEAISSPQTACTGPGAHCAHSMLGWHGKCAAYGMLAGPNASQHSVHSADCMYRPDRYPLLSVTLGPACILWTAIASCQPCMLLHSEPWGPCMLHTVRGLDLAPWVLHRGSIPL